MTPVVLLLTAVALSMDALAVSISNGMTIKHLRLRDALKTGFFFGAFQALMPAIGWLAGTSVREMIVSLDHWVAFGLLALIGGKMIWDTVHGEDDEHVSNPTDTRVLLVMRSPRASTRWPWASAWRWSRCPSPRPPRPSAW